MQRASFNAKFLGVVAAACLLTLAFASVAQAKGDEAPSRPQAYVGAEVVDTATPYVFEGDVRRLPTAREWRPGDAIKEIPRRTHPRDLGGELYIPPQEAPNIDRDPLLDQQDRYQRLNQLRVFTSPTINTAGQGFTGVNPPDTVGDVGINYYIQSINGSGGALFRIHNKSTGAVVSGPTAMDSLGSGNCASGRGDPIVLFDQLASRWFLAEFSNTGNFLCVYVSQTSDPITGGWFNYAFQAPSFPDYPKFAVWPDAYYAGTNENNAAVYAFDRSAMIAGNTASFQRLTVPSLAGFGFQMLIPSDVDGATAPPAGSPNYFMRHRDDEVHNAGSANGSQDFLEIWQFSVDFANASNSAITGPFNIAIAEIDSTLCGTSSFSCIPQPSGSSPLDPLREVVMWRLTYRNFPTHQTLVGNLATDVGANRAGVRWFELRNTGSGWTLFQEGTYSPGSLNRWMGAIAMDGDGNIGLGYNVSSSSVFPGLRYTGRLATDPLGVMTQPETTLIAGSGSNSSIRYGDYSAMSVDPVDDCTFWFTGEYNASSQWSTRIGSFSFDSCGSSTCNPQAVANAGPDQNICAGESATIGTAALAGHSYSWSPGGATSAQITVSPSSTTTYTVTATTACGSATDTVTVNVDSGGGGGGLSEDFEGGLGSWTTSGLWHLVSNSSCASPGFSSPVNAVYYGQDASCDYDTGGTTTGDLISPVISGIDSSSTLSFDYFRVVESFGGGSFDQTEVAVSVAGSGSWTTVFSLDSGDASTAAWTSSGNISLSAFAGNDIQVRFRFNSVDGVANNFTGWFIDDVEVTGSSSCGGGTDPVTVTFTSIAGEDGRIWEASETSSTGGGSNATTSNGTALRAGDLSADRQYKSVVSFDTSSIPAGATIQSAELRLVRGGQSGTNPFTILGNCQVDVQSGAFSGNNAIQTSDWQASATAVNAGLLSSVTANGQTSTASLNAAGLAAINTSGRTQLRFFFQTEDNDDGGFDYVSFWSGEAANAANRPVLVVTYVP